YPKSIDVLVDECDVVGSGLACRARSVVCIVYAFWLQEVVGVVGVEEVVESALVSAEVRPKSSEPSTLSSCLITWSTSHSNMPLCGHTVSKSRSRSPPPATCEA